MRRRVDSCLPLHRRGRGSTCNGQASGDDGGGGREEEEEGGGGRGGEKLTGETVDLTGGGMLGGWRGETSAIVVEMEVSADGRWYSWQVRGGRM